MPRTVFPVALVLILSLSFHAQATQGQVPAAPPPSDPQAVAVVQTAITALGGGTAIAQAQNWTSQGSLGGPFTSGTWNEIVTRYSAAPSGTPNVAPRRPVTSLLVPALVGAVLLQESRDPHYVMHYEGPTTLNSVAVTEIVFSRARTAMFDAQNWYFDAATGLPAQVQFKLPAQIGLMKSPLGVAVFSNYQAVSGVLHPFHIVMSIQGIQQPEVISIQSVSANAVVSSNAPTTAGGAQ